MKIKNGKKQCSMLNRLMRQMEYKRNKGLLLVELLVVISINLFLVFLAAEFLKVPVLIGIAFSILGWLGLLFTFCILMYWVYKDENN